MILFLLLSVHFFLSFFLRLQPLPQPQNHHRGKSLETKARGNVVGNKITVVNSPITGEEKQKKKRKKVKGKSKIELQTTRR